MPFDLFSPVTMDALVRTMPATPGFLMKTFFPRAVNLTTTDVVVDFYKGKRRVAPFANPSGVSGVAQKIGYSNTRYETPLVAVKDVTDIEDVLQRLPGELLVNSGIGLEQRGMELMATTLQDFNEQIARREEVMAAQALFAGTIDVIGEGVNYKIDIPFTNKSTVSTLWDAASSTADPLADLRTAALKCMENGYRKPNICVMARNAYSAFVQRLTQLGYLDQRHLLDVDLAPEMENENVTYCGHLRELDLDVYLYDEWYVDDWSDEVLKEKPMVPMGKVLLASTRARTSVYYGILGFTDVLTRQIRQVIGARGADSWVSKEPDQRFLKLMSRPLPIPHEVDSWYVLTVAAQA